MHANKPAHTPSLSRTSLTLIDGELLADPYEHGSMVGPLQYLIMTKLDIAFVIHVVSQFMHTPHATHSYPFFLVLVGHIVLWTSALS